MIYEMEFDYIFQQPNPFGDGNIPVHRRLDITIAFDFEMDIEIKHIVLGIDMSQATTIFPRAVAGPLLEAKGLSIIPRRLVKARWRKTNRSLSTEDMGALFGVPGMEEEQIARAIVSEARRLGFDGLLEEESHRMVLQSRLIMDAEDE